MQQMDMTESPRFDSVRFPQAQPNIDNAPIDREHLKHTNPKRYGGFHMTAMNTDQTNPTGRAIPAVHTIDTATGKQAPADISADRVYEIFSTIAKKYERFNALSSMGAYKLWLRGMMRQAPIAPGDNVLDIAGGTGDVAFSVARAKHPAHIQITDLVPEMLDVARAHVAEGAAEDVPVDFEVVDAQAIPYPDESYDAITMAYGIRNMPNRELALREMYRVLKPGGSLVCLEFSRPPFAPWRALYTFYLKHMIPLIGGAVTGDKEGFVYLSKSIKAFPDQKTYADMLYDTGFTKVTWKNYTGGIAAVHVAEKPNRP
ncbi:MAG: class I SAM-dependent methyltransferase [Raoultibacter sp.]